MTGSLAHVEDIAIAAVAGAANAIGLGVDIEPDTPLPEGVAEIVATVAERARYSADIIGSRTLFVVKEAVFKAVHPSDGVFLEHDAIDVDLDSGVATIAYGRIVPFKVARARHIIALAIIA